MRLKLRRGAAVGGSLIGHGIRDFSQVAVDFQSWRIVGLLRALVRRWEWFVGRIGHKEFPSGDYVDFRTNFATNDSSCAHEGYSRRPGEPPD